MLSFLLSDSLLAGLLVGLVLILVTMVLNRVLEANRDEVNWLRENIGRTVVDLQNRTVHPSDVDETQEELTRMSARLIKLELRLRWRTLALLLGVVVSVGTAVLALAGLVRAATA